MKNRFTGLAIAGALTLSGACENGSVTQHESAPTTAVPAPSTPPLVQSTTAIEQTIKHAEAQFESEVLTTKRAHATALIGVCSVFGTKNDYYLVANPVALFVKNPSGKGEIQVTAAYDTTNHSFVYGGATLYDTAYSATGPVRQIAGHPSQIDLFFTNAADTKPAPEELRFIGENDGFRNTGNAVVGTVGVLVSTEVSLDLFAQDARTISICTRDIATYGGAASSAASPVTRA